MLTGCATVSMVSTDAIVETERSDESSALAESARAFNTRAEAQGWVGEPRSLMDFASVLFSGNSEQTGRKAGTYAERIAASDEDVATVFETITDDARSTLQAFSEVQTVADTLLDENDVVRTDLINFETALVTAQKSYRGFAEATGIAANRGDEGLDETEAALKELAAAVDTARKTADRLADAYALEDEADDAAAAS